MQRNRFYEDVAPLKQDTDQGFDYDVVPLQKYSEDKFGGQVVAVTDPVDLVEDYQHELEDYADSEKIE